MMNAKTILDVCKGIRPLENKTLFLTGSLLGLEYEQAVEFLKELGGSVRPELTSATDFWIVGTARSQDQAEDEPGDEAFQMELEQANKCRQSPLLVLSQRQLLAMIPGGLDTVKAMM
jgi:BRCA1 C Terminus (BRCT) domain